MEVVKIAKPSVRILRNLKKGKPATLKKGDEMELFVSPANKKKIERAFKKDGKGVRVTLSADELTNMEGKGIWDSIKKGVSKVGRALGSATKKVKETVTPIATTVGKVAKPVAKKIVLGAVDEVAKELPKGGEIGGATAGAMAGEAIAVGLEQPELAPAFGAIGSKIGSKAGKALGEKAKKEVKKETTKARRGRPPKAKEQLPIPIAEPETPKLPKARRPRQPRPARSSKRIKPDVTQKDVLDKFSISELEFMADKKRQMQGAPRLDYSGSQKTFGGADPVPESDPRMRGQGLKEKLEKMQIKSKEMRMSGKGMRLGEDPATWTPKKRMGEDPSTWSPVKVITEQKRPDIARGQPMMLRSGREFSSITGSKMVGGFRHQAFMSQPNSEHYQYKYRLGTAFAKNK